MKKFKKLLGFLLLTAMTLSLCACLDDEYDDDYDYSYYDDSEDEGVAFKSGFDSKDGRDVENDTPFSVLFGDTEDRTTSEFLDNHPGYEDPTPVSELSSMPIVKCGTWEERDTDDRKYYFYGNGMWERYSDSEPSFAASGSYELCGDWVRMYFDDGSDPVWMFEFDTGVYSGELGVLDADYSAYIDENGFVTYGDDSGNAYDGDGTYEGVVDKEAEEFQKEHLGYEPPASPEEVAHAYIVQTGLWYVRDREGLYDHFYRFYDDGTWERYCDTAPGFEATGTFQLCGNWLRINFDDGSDTMWLMDFDTGIYTGVDECTYSIYSVEYGLPNEE